MRALSAALLLSICGLAACSDDDYGRDLGLDIGVAEADAGVDLAKHVDAETD